MAQETRPTRQSYTCNCETTRGSVLIADVGEERGVWVSRWNGQPFNRWEGGKMGVPDEIMQRASKSDDLRCPHCDSDVTRDQVPVIDPDDLSSMDEVFCALGRHGTRATVIAVEKLPDDTVREHYDAGILVNIETSSLAQYPKGSKERINARDIVRIE